MLNLHSKNFKVLATKSCFSLVGKFLILFARFIIIGIVFISFHFIFISRLAGDPRGYRSPDQGAISPWGREELIRGRYWGFWRIDGRGATNLGKGGSSEEEFRIVGGRGRIQLGRRVCFAQGLLQERSIGRVGVQPSQLLHRSVDTDNVREHAVYISGAFCGRPWLWGGAYDSSIPVGYSDW
jgi:hypothetical protein